MEKYYIAYVEVIVESNLPEIISVTGSHFSLDNVKRYAENIVRQDNPNKKITSKLHQPVQYVTAEEYEKIFGKRPSFGDAWMGGKA